MIRLIRDTPAAAAMMVAALGAATILGALFFEYGLRLRPCPLCLEQRIPYYIAIPLAALLAVAAWRRAPRAVLVTGFAAIVLVMLWGAGLGAYHAGVEWKWWAGPQDCAAPITDLGSAADLLRNLQNLRIVRCDEAPWRFLGLSLAGWNVLISLALAATALVGIAAVRSPKEATGSGALPR